MSAEYVRTEVSRPHECLICWALCADERSAQLHAEWHEEAGR